MGKLGFTERQWDPCEVSEQKDDAVTSGLPFTWDSPSSCPRPGAGCSTSLRGSAQVRPGVTLTTLKGPEDWGWEILLLGPRIKSSSLLKD